MSLRVIQVSTGNVGAFALRAILGHPELELAGLWVHSPSKAGRDAAEFCDGTSDTCPANVAANSGVVCRKQHPACQAAMCGDPCDQEEVCDGVSTSCPPDVKKPSTTVCRISSHLRITPSSCVTDTGLPIR